MPVVRIPSVLRKHTDGAAKVEVSGSTVRDVFSKLVAEHPGLESELFDGDGLRGFINVYVDDEDIRYVDGLDTPAAEDTEVAIMPAVAGGAERSEHARRGMVAGGAERSEHARHGIVAGGAGRG